MGEEESIGEKFGEGSSPVCNSIRMKGGPFRLRSDGFDPGPGQKAPDEPFFESPTHNSSSFSLCSYSSVRKRPEPEPGCFQPGPITTFSAPLWCFSRPHFHQHLPRFLSTYSESFHVLWRGRVRIHTRISNRIPSKCTLSKKSQRIPKLWNSMRCFKGLGSHLQFDLQSDT